MRPVELQSERLVLSTPVESDIDRITEYCQDPLFEKVITTPWPYTRAHGATFVREAVPDAWSNGSEFTWAIRETAGGPLMGVVSWRRRGDIGYWMGAPHRGHGYMTEALTTVVDWVFREGLADRVEWETLVGNVDSARVARAAGFTFRGAAPVVVPNRDGSIREGWHGELRATDGREIKRGWPL